MQASAHLVRKGSSTMAKLGKRTFQMGACAQKPPPAKLPKAAEVKISAIGAPLRWLPPPDLLLERLGDPPTVVGFDIERTRGTARGSEVVCSRGHEHSMLSNGLQPLGRMTGQMNTTGEVTSAS